MNTIIARFLQFPKRLLLLVGMLLCFLSFALVPATALAATKSCGATDVHCVIQFGDQQITNRINDLNKLSAKVTDDHNKQLISDADADALQNDITTNINGLNALKTKLDAETDAKAARQDVENIYTQFRIYAVVIPRDTRTLQLDIEKTVYNKLYALEQPTQTAINNAPASEQSKLNSLFSDYQAQLADANTNITQAESILSSSVLTPANYNNDRSTYTTNLKNLTTDVKTAHQDLRKAAADLHQIAQILKSTASNS